MLMTRLTPIARGQTAAKVAGPSIAEQLRAYLHIAPSGGITVTVPASEMGQGATTTLPMILCDQLDVSWNRVRYEQAMPTPLFGGMVTEASATTRQFFPVLRKVGATARLMSSQPPLKGGASSRARARRLQI